MEKPTFGRIVRNNLFIVLGAAVVLGMVAQFSVEGALMLFGLFYLGQALVNFILAFTRLGSKPGEVGAAPYFLSMLLVLIIGFGACSGLFVITGNLGNMRI
jgi:multicomponent K+:H+ antiporter subunit F